MIGLASLVASAATGKIPGLSGVMARLLTPHTTDKAWRLLFLIGLLIGAAISFYLVKSTGEYRPQGTTLTIAIAGLLVGIGTRVGGGCTSGHGVCGIGRGAKDSLLATITFMVSGIITVYIIKQLLG